VTFDSKALLASTSTWLKTQLPSVQTLANELISLVEANTNKPTCNAKAKSTTSSLKTLFDAIQSRLEHEALDLISATLMHEPLLFELLRVHALALHQPDASSYATSTLSSLQTMMRMLGSSALSAVLNACLSSALTSTTLAVILVSGLAQLACSSRAAIASMASSTMTMLDTKHTPLLEATLNTLQRERYRKATQRLAMHRMIICFVSESIMASAEQPQVYEAIRQLVIDLSHSRDVIHFAARDALARFAQAHRQHLVALTSRLTQAEIDTLHSKCQISLGVSSDEPQTACIAPLASSITLPLALEHLNTLATPKQQQQQQQQQQQDTVDLRHDNTIKLSHSDDIANNNSQSNDSDTDSGVDGDDRQNDASRFNVRVPLCEPATPIATRTYNSDDDDDDVITFRVRTPTLPSFARIATIDSCTQSHNGSDQSATASTQSKCSNDTPPPMPTEQQPSGPIATLVNRLEACCALTCEQSAIELVQSCSRIVERLQYNGNQHDANDPVVRLFGAMIRALDALVQHRWVCPSRRQECVCPSGATLLILTNECCGVQLSCIESLVLDMSSTWALIDDATSRKSCATKLCQALANGCSALDNAPLLGVAQRVVADMVAHFLHDSRFIVESLFEHSKTKHIGLSVVCALLHEFEPQIIKTWLPCLVPVLIEVLMQTSSPSRSTVAYSSVVLLMVQELAVLTSDMRQTSIDSLVLLQERLPPSDMERWHEKLQPPQRKLVQLYAMSKQRRVVQQQCSHHKQNV
jgi:hypothetical protein